MGFFDDLIKNVDKGLKAIEDGALEERLQSVADKLDQAGTRTEQVLQKAADTPRDLLTSAEEQKQQLQTKAEAVKAQVGKTIEAVHKKH